MADMAAFADRCRAYFGTLRPGEQKTLVFGEGCADNPPLMLIGEAPGAQEALRGRPFVGKAGKNLDGFLGVIGRERGDIWISNVVKVRPVRVSAKGTVANRPPDREEVRLFAPYLYEEILLVRPALLVTLGNVALRALLGRDATIGENHGRLVSARVTAGDRTATFPLFPLYHPASVIYNRELQDVYQSDLLKLKQTLDGPLS